MDHLAREGRLMRHYTQNVDRIEHFLPALEAKTVRLHGQVDQARCPRCNWTCAIDPRILQAEAIGCKGHCLSRSLARESQGKRPLGIGKLRPDILLYEEANPFEDQIFARLEEDRQGCPDLVIVVGTRLSIPGARGIAKDLCDHALKSGGKTA